MDIGGIYFLMSRLSLLAIFFLMIAAGSAKAACGPLPYTFEPDTLGSAEQINANFAALLACASGGPPAVASNAQLQALNSTVVSQIYRGGYISNGDDGGQLYYSSNSPCSLNSGAGDNGSQVASADNKCWIANFSDTKHNVKIWGAKCDGITDDSTAIQSAVNFGGTALIPNATCFTAIGITVNQATSQLAGSNYVPIPNSGSVIKCALSVSPCVTSGTGTNGTANVHDLQISRAAGSIPSTAVGLLINGSQDVLVRDIFTYRHAEAIETLNSGVFGIYTYLDHVRTCGTTDADLVVSGVPGVYVYNSLFGCNGAFDQTHNAYVRVTGNWDNTKGTIHFVNDQFNLGQNTVICGFAFQNFSGAANLLYDFKIIGGHLETAQNVFCSDNTVLGLNTFMVDAAWIGGGWGGANRIFADLSNGLAAGLNPATSLTVINFANASFTGFGDLTLDPTVQMADVRIHDSSFLNNTVNITGVSNSSLQLVNNTYGGNVTLSGSYAFARASGAFQAGAFTNSASGSVEADFPGPGQNSLTNNSSTCKLAIGGSTTGITYTQQPVSQWQLVGNQVHVSIYMSITSLGGLTGAAMLTGCLPYNAAASNVSFQPMEGTGWTSLTSPVLASPAASGKTLNLYETGTAGLNVITNTNISAGPTTLYGEVVYTVATAP